MSRTTVTTTMTFLSPFKEVPSLVHPLFEGGEHGMIVKRYVRSAGVIPWFYEEGSRFERMRLEPVRTKGQKPRQWVTGSPVGKF